MSQARVSARPQPAAFCRVRAHSEGSRPGRRLPLVCGVTALGAVIVCLATAVASGDDTIPDYYEGGGILFRAAHIEGQGIPQIRSITPLELFPYYIADQHLIFS